MVVGKNQRGAITVEAAIVLPVFICIAVSLAMLIKLVYVHDVIQHAIDEAANELAAYAYVYHVSDLQDIDTAIQDTMGDGAQQAEEHTKAFVDAYTTIDKTIQAGNAAAKDMASISEGKGALSSLQDILNEASKLSQTGEQLTQENMQNIKRLQQVMDEVSKDPRKEAESIAWMLSKGVYSDAKTVIAVPIVRQAVKKHLLERSSSDPDAKLKRLHIAGGLGGLDFFSSSFFKENQDIDIIVKYKIELPLPVKLLPDLYLVQRSTARAWLEGGDGEALVQMDIWALPNKQRGLKIEEMYGGNLPYGFPIIDIYDDSTKTGTSIKSINLNSKTYRDAENLRKKLTSYIDDLKDSNVITYKGIDYSLQNKTFVLVIPKDSLNDGNRRVLEDIIGYARSYGIQMTINEL